MWKIADNGTDSSATKWDAQSGVHSHFQQIRTTGNLVVWGWLSDRGVVAPENAWVGIFGLMKYEGGPTDMVWTPLQIQPWIKGVNSSQLQYVGFNVPVKEGL